MLRIAAVSRFATLAPPIRGCNFGQTAGRPSEKLQLGRRWCCGFSLSSSIDLDSTKLPVSHCDKAHFPARWHNSPHSVYVNFRILYGCAMSCVDRVLHHCETVFEQFFSKPSIGTSFVRRIRRQVEHCYYPHAAPPPRTNYGMTHNISS